MVLVSNDFFVANDNALDISSVLSGGGPITIDVVSVYDAGTEFNDFAASAEKSSKQSHCLCTKAQLPFI